MQEKIEMTKAQMRYINDTTRELLVEGSAGSGKTIFACFKVIFYALQNRDARIYVYRVTLPSLKKTAWLEIKNILLKYHIQFEEKRAEGRIEFPQTNSTIYFGALDELSKVRSINADLIYIEQAEELLNEAFYVELMLRLGRGEASKRPDGYSQMILVVQPESEEHWIYKHFHEFNDVKAKTDATGKVIKTYDEVLAETQRKRKTVHFHYSENYKLPAESRQYYDDLKNIDYELWLRYSAGKWGKISNVIYPNYDTVVLRDKFEMMTLGIDFGFNNPSAVLLVGWYDQEAYILDEIYETKLLNSELIEKTRDMLFKHKLLPEHLNLVVCDSAEPDRIEEFRQSGFPALGGVKNVTAKINTTKQTRLHIHPRCENMLKEIKGYKYRVDKDGVTTDEPLKINDHCCDALGYVVYEVRGNLSPNRPKPQSYYEENIIIW